MYKVTIESVDEVTEYRLRFSTKQSAKEFAERAVDKKMKESKDSYAIIIEEEKEEPNCTLAMQQAMFNTRMGM